MMNFTTESTIFDCESEDIKFYISLGINILLGSFSVISELMGASKCKSNGIIDGIKKSMSGRNLENPNEESFNP